MSNVYLDVSPIAGTGVFALRPFRAGEWILSFAEGDPEVLPHAATTGGGTSDGLFLQIGFDSYILPYPPSLYVNHSCEPNAGVRERTELFALTDIEAGAEITFDYSTSMAEDGWEMDCACGAAACRGRVRDFKHLPDERQSFYVSRGLVGDFCAAAIAGLTR